MELKKRENLIEEKLSYYSKKDIAVSENYELLGFKHDLAMISPIQILKELSAAEEAAENTVVETCPPPDPNKNVKKVKLEVDPKGQKFISLNGKKLKVLNQTQVPLSSVNGTDKQMVVKHKTINIGSASAPMKVRVISRVTQVKPSTQLDVNTGAPKFVKIDSSKLPDNKTTLEANNKTITSSLHLPRIFRNDIEKYVLNETECSENPCETPITYKLLSEKTLKILNTVKMKALNLSMKDSVKDNENGQKKSLEFGIQTDPPNTRENASQTEKFPNFSDMDFDSWLDFNSRDASPVINNVNLGVGPSIEKFIVPVKNDSIANSDVKSDEMKKKLAFFEDLRNALMPDASGNLLIHEGVLKQDKALVKRMCIVLKARHTDVNQENHDGCTPLQLAVINNVHHDIVQTLLDYGAEVGDCDGDGNNIIHLAAKFERKDVLSVIFYHRLFESHYRQHLDSFNFEGLTPLMICCMNGWYDGVGLCVHYGSDVNLRDQKSGRTALFHAAEIYHEPIVRMLLGSKADTKIKNFFGTSPHDAMYELEEMPETIKNLIFGKSKRRSVEAEMNPVRTAKAAKILKTYPKFKKVEHRGGMILLSTGIKAEPQPQHQRSALLPLQPQRSAV